MRWLASVVLTVFWLACGSDEPQPAATSDAGSDPAPVETDSAPVCLTRCPEAAGEADRCEACFENVGRCCYPETPDIEGHIPGLVFNCAVTLGCSSCCDECAAMSCEQMIANGNCPFTELP